VGAQLAELHAASHPNAAGSGADYNQLNGEGNGAEALSAAFEAAKLTCDALVQWLLATAQGVPACPVHDLSRGWEDLHALESSLEAQLTAAQAGVVEAGDVGASAEFRGVLAATLELLPLVLADCPSSAAAHARRLQMSKGRHLRAQVAALRREQHVWMGQQRQRSGRSQFALASALSSGETAPRLPRVLHPQGAPHAPQASAGFQLLQPRLGVWVPDATFSAAVQLGHESAAPQHGPSAGMPHDGDGGEQPATQESAMQGPLQGKVPTGGHRAAWHTSTGKTDPRRVGTPHVAMLDGSRVPFTRASAIAQRAGLQALAAEQEEDEEGRAGRLDVSDALRFAQWDSRGHGTAGGSLSRHGSKEGRGGAQDDQLQALLAACEGILEQRV
jgi:hypothetical protein